MIETLTLSDRERATHEPLLERFHAGLYSSEFAAQAEPLDVWKQALWGGDAEFRWRIRLALDAGEIVGGITFEHYPRSNCGVVTYVVVAPQSRGSGLGQDLRRAVIGTLYSEGSRAVFGEVNDPRLPHSYETPETSWKRILRFQRSGSRVCDTRYAQPSLGPGLSRDRGVALMRHPGDAPPLTEMPGEIVRDFVREFYAVTERTDAIDDELRAILDGIPDTVKLIELKP